MIPFSHVIILSGILFLLGTVCTLVRRNLIMILIGVEIMLNASGIAFIGASLRWGNLSGQVFVLFILAVAAAEVGVGLALVIYGHRRTGETGADRYNLLKG
jgi:NADH-quinone oxidoreductase subunit K